MRIDVRGDNVTIPHHTRELIDRKTRLSLGRVAGEINQVRVVVTDPNGPKRGVDRHCSIMIRLRRGGEIHVSASDEVLQDAVDRVLERVSRSLRRVIARQQEFRRDSVRLRGDWRY